MNSQYSFIVITYNEEMHLPRLLQSISDLDAQVFVLDSGSTDRTVMIAEQFGALTLQHPFENHPRQWHFALTHFPVATPWVICLDADQIVTPELKAKLAEFKDEDYTGVDGIYFNRKNFFKGSWIKHGGYSPLYLLKMIRFGVGFSDLNENMDHRFIVPGKTVIWKDGYILEENLKENNISFWIRKHNRYSDLVAQEEVERIQLLRKQTISPRFFGSPDERTAWLKQRWWKMPRYVRPVIYFLYRMFFQLGILDGRTGIIFHFLQAFWFRLIVDVKIDELMSAGKVNTPPVAAKHNEPVRFVITFLVLFLSFYYFNILFFGITQPGNHYSPWLAHHLNYIQALRVGLLKCSAQLLKWMGFSAITNQYELLVAGHGIIQLVYSCLGLGLISFFAAFVLSYPKKWKSKITFLIVGILGIEFLNILRFVVLALFWHHNDAHIVDHHTLFNIFIYLVIAVTLYFWVKNDKVLSDNGSKN